MEKKITKISSADEACLSMSINKPSMMMMALTKKKSSEKKRNNQVSKNIVKQKHAVV